MHLFLDLILSFDLFQNFPGFADARRSSSTFRLEFLRIFSCGKIAKKSFSKNVFKACFCKAWNCKEYEKCKISLRRKTKCSLIFLPKEGALWKVNNGHAAPSRSQIIHIPGIFLIFVLELGDDSSASDFNYLKVINIMKSLHSNLRFISISINLWEYYEIKMRYLIRDEFPYCLTPCNKYFYRTWAKSFHEIQPN